jgi:transposase
MIMEEVKIKRIDHLGIVSGIIKDLGIVEKIDERIPSNPEEEITTGEAIAGMILNGLGFSDRPLTLVPQFFENKPLEILFRKGIQASHFNRFKLGRSLDKAYEYGCDLLFNELATKVCEQEQIDMKYNCLDTTSFSLTGEYRDESDENAIKITHGYSKDHRPDLKQAVLELMVSEDGGIPFMSKSFSGNGSDNNIFRERSNAIIEELENSPTPRYLLADSKLYTAKNAKNLSKIGFVTRIPHTINDVNKVIEQAWQLNLFQPIDENYSYCRVDLGHYHIVQRWIVVYSKESWKLSERTINKAKDKESKKFQKKLYHLQAKRFSSEEKARDALNKIVLTLLYHNLYDIQVKKHIKYVTKGRPQANSPIKEVQWQINASLSIDPAKIEKKRHHKACFVLGTNIDEKELEDSQVLKTYKILNNVEKGFRFLKDPVFFTSSLFLKKPSRIQGLLMVMTLALLVYSIAQRRMRQILKKKQQTLPNQINKPIESPTLRWVFQMLEGINIVFFFHEGKHEKTFIEGINDLRRNILTLFGTTVARMYKIPIS